jgi:PadR family transcriptional regulator, regulatory protein PadR
MRRRDYLGHLELLVLLGIWRLQPEAYGVSVAREIEKQCGYSVSLAGIYSSLERLQEKKLIRSTLGAPTPARCGRARTFFELTAAGQQEARATHNALTRLVPKGAL